MSQQPQTDPSKFQPIPMNRVSILPTHRAADKKKVDDLMESIGSLGLLQPIGVVPDEDRGGSFVLVFGRHRLEAHRKLGRDVIEARVFDFDPADAEAAMIVENLHRRELDRKAKYDAADRFTAWHLAKFPEMHGRGAYQKKDEGDQKPTVGLCPQEVGAEPAAPPAEEKPKAKRERKPAGDEYADKAGVGKSTGKDMVRIAKNLTKPQRDVLVDRGVIHRDVIRISAVADEEQRGKVVNLVASGMDIETALAAGQAPPSATVEVVSNPPDPDAPKVPAEADMTDDQWIDFYCAEALGRIKCRAIYRADAAFYRKTRKINADYKAKMRTPLAASKVGPISRGIFHNMVGRICRISHPKDWLTCGRCNGTGMYENRSDCPSCNGRGYDVTTEYR